MSQKQKGSAPFDHHEIEQRWKEFWESKQIYAWDPTRPRSETYIVDTPPPTVSGSLHMGHIFSYTHADIIVRFQRMRGKNIMYPMGWDDNGLPTERRVQNTFGITCNPSLAYDYAWRPEKTSDRLPKKEVSRRNFIEACSVLTQEDEVAFESLWRRLGLSVDWSQQYATIDSRSRLASQRSFLDLWDKGLVYNLESPTMWDVTFSTAIAQAELEDRETEGAFHDLRFGIEGGGSFVISTTRPELLASCIAVVAHPDDSRYQPLFGKTAITPLFYAPVPILASAHASPDKGTGIMMVCTFGDSADVDWWKQSSLGLRLTIDRAGRMKDVRFGSGAFPSGNPEKANSAYGHLTGKTVKQVRLQIVELLQMNGTSGDEQQPGLSSAPKPIRHAVKFYEKGDQPIEFVTSRQWFVRILKHRDELLAQGRKISWHPEHMLARYENWVQGLNCDWCISRQRYFGVPFPLWYAIDSAGKVDYEDPILAEAQTLPVDPLADCPPGYTEDQRGKPNGFIGDPDVMDTWATSSLTPQIISGWGTDAERHGKLFPMDLRPQSHEIIRTWAFYTIVKAWMHEQEIPWKSVAISGWILDPDRKKMSKSAGNVITPDKLLDENSSDAVRYWASRARLGVDTAFDPTIFQSGRKLSIKLFNITRFILAQVERIESAAMASRLSMVSQELDVSWISMLDDAVRRATASFEQLDFAGALAIIEQSFWEFCDNYVELVKGRSYGEPTTPGRDSAIAALYCSLSTYLRLFAPFLPYITEELWSQLPENRGERGSIHRAEWPVASVNDSPLEEPYKLACHVLIEIRKAKAEAHRGMKWPVRGVTIRGVSAALFEGVFEDLIRAGAIENNALTQSELSAGDGEYEVLVDLAQGET